MLGTLPLILAGIQAAIQAAPGALKVIAQAKAFITSLFEAGLISKAQQDRTHSEVDAICAAMLAGQIPPELTIEPDPA
jgi:outer membrane protein TolC